MGIVWLLAAVVVVAVGVPLIRHEIKLRRRAASEMPAGLSGPALGAARRAKLAELRYSRRSTLRPAGNTSDAGGPGGAVDGGHGGGHG